MQLVIDITSRRSYGKVMQDVRQETAKTRAPLAGLRKQIAGLFAGVSAGLLVRELRAAHDAAVLYEDSLLRSQTLVGISREQIDAWRPSIARLAADLGRLPQELSESIFFITSGGQRGAAALDLLEESGKAAAVGLGRTASIADAAGSALNAYGEEALTAEEAVNVLFETVREGKLAADSLAPSLGKVIGLASEMGVEFGEVGSFLATYTRLGGSADEATFSLSSVLTSLLKPTDEAGKALARLGLSSAGLRRQIREEGLAETLIGLATAIGGNETALTEVIPEVRALRGFLAVAGEQAETYRGITERLTDDQLELADAFRTVKEESPGQRLAELRAEIELHKIEIGSRTIPVYAGFLEVIRDILRATELWTTWETKLLNTRRESAKADIAAAKAHWAAVAAETAAETENLTSKTEELIGIYGNFTGETVQVVGQLETLEEKWERQARAVEDAAAAYERGRRAVAKIRAELAEAQATNLPFGQDRPLSSDVIESGSEGDIFGIGIGADEMLAELTASMEPLKTQAAQVLELFAMWGIKIEEAHGNAEAVREALAEQKRQEEERQARTERWVSSLWLAADAFAGMNNQVGDLLSGLARGVAIAIEMAREIGGVAGAVVGILNGLQASGIGFGSTGDSILSGAASGASIGAMFGPQFAVPGAIWGATLGLITDIFSETAQGFVDAGAHADGIRSNLAQGEMSQQVQGVMDTISSTFNDWLEALGGTVTNFTELGILWRQDSQGLRVAIDGVWTSFGDNVSGAIDFALGALAKRSDLAGISPTAKLAIEEFVGSSFEALQAEIERAASLVDTSSLVANYNTLFGIEEDAGDVVLAKIKLLEAEVKVRIVDLKAEEARLKVMLAGTEVTIATVQGLETLAEVTGALGIVAGASAETIAAALVVVGESIEALEALDFSPEAINAAVAAARAAAAGAGRATGGGFSGDSQADIARTIELLRLQAEGRHEEIAAMERHRVWQDRVNNGWSEADATLAALYEDQIRAAEAMRALSEGIASLASQADSLGSQRGRGLAGQIDDIFGQLQQTGEDLITLFSGIIPAEQLIKIQNADIAGNVDEVRRLLDLFGVSPEDRENLMEILRALADLAGGGGAINDVVAATAAGISPTLAAVEAQILLNQNIETLRDHLGPWAMDILEADAALQQQLSTLSHASGLISFGKFLAEATGNSEALAELNRKEFILRIAEGRIRVAQARLMLEALGQMSPAYEALFDMIDILNQDLENDFPQILENIGDAAAGAGQSLDSLLDPLRSIRDDLLVGPSSPFTAEFQLQQARAAFGAERDRVLGAVGTPGFEDELQDTAQIIQALIGAGGRFGGGAPGAIASEILQFFDQVPGVGSALTGSPEAPQTTLAPGSLEPITGLQETGNGYLREIRDDQRTWQDRMLERFGMPPEPGRREVAN